MLLSKRKVGITMATIKYSLDENTSLTEEQIKRLEEVKNMPITFDEDSPEVTEEMIKTAYRPRAAKKPKKMISMYLSEEDIDYFKTMSLETGIPYQTLIGMYLTDCRQKERKIKLDWQEPA